MVIQILLVGGMSIRRLTVLENIFGSLRPPLKHTFIFKVSFIKYFEKR